MERQYVRSSNLNSVRYEEEIMMLEIVFNSGAVYQYSGVPPYHFIGLMNAASKGRYFDRFIRKMGYRYQQVGGMG